MAVANKPLKKSLDKASKRTQIKSTKSKKADSSSIISDAAINHSFGIRNATQFNINSDNALNDPFVYSCINVLSESIASLPLTIRLNNQEVQDFYLYKLLKLRPNEEQSIYEVLQWLTIDYYRYGVAFAFCPRDKFSNEIIGIYPLPANMVKPFRDENSNVFYGYKDWVFEAKDVVVLRNFYCRGIEGNAQIDLQKNTLGISAATEAFAGSSYTKGLFPSGFVSLKDNSTQEELEELKDQFLSKFSGANNAGNILLSSCINDYKPFAIDNTKAQMIESRKFNRSIIAGLYRVPAHLINDLEKSTFSNVEHLDISFVKHTLRPICKNFEQKLNSVLLTEDELLSGYNISFNLDAMLRGDLLSRTQAESQAIQNGLKTINEVRSLEGLPPVEGGDILRTNSSLMPLDYADKKLSATTTI